jgi:DNA-directed RNA polymerase subunit K/omega
MEGDDENSVKSDDNGSIVSETANNLTDDDIESDVEDEEEDNEETKPKNASTASDNYVHSSDEENEEDYFEKFDESVRKSVVEMYHPETKSVNQAELLKMATVTRNERGIIIDDLHRSIPMMTKYEYTTILGQRAQQLDEGDAPLVKVPNGVMDGYLIAQMELEQKRIPFIIKRPIPGCGFEYWHVEDLEIIHEPLH